VTDAEQALVEVGRIGRAHGVRGELHVVLTTDRLERVAPGSVLTIAGGSRSLTVAASRPKGDRHVVRFAGVDSREDAERLVNSVLMAPPLVDDDALWVHDLIGSEVVETDGRPRGRCIAVVDNPAHLLLELDSGALVPVPFVVSCRDKVTVVATPEGLFDDDA
jgi:16S rRNA processing protein RimM